MLLTSLNLSAVISRSTSQIKAGVPLKPSYDIHIKGLFLEELPELID